SVTTSSGNRDRAASARKDPRLTTVPMLPHTQRVPVPPGTARLAMLGLVPLPLVGTRTDCARNGARILAGQFNSLIVQMVDSPDMLVVRADHIHMLLDLRRVHYCFLSYRARQGSPHFYVARFAGAGSGFLCTITPFPETPNSFFLRHLLTLLSRLGALV